MLKLSFMTKNWIENQITQLEAGVDLKLASTEVGIIAHAIIPTFTTGGPVNESALLKLAEDVENGAKEEFGASRVTAFAHPEVVGNFRYRYGLMGIPAKRTFLASLKEVAPTVHEAFTAEITKQNKAGAAKTAQRKKADARRTARSGNYVFPLWIRELV